LDIAVYTNDEAFRTLHDQWHALLPTSATNTVFSTPEWLESWWQVFSLGRPLHLVTIRRDGALLGIAPLMQSTDNGRRCRCFIGGLDVSDYFDLLPQAGHEEDFLSGFLDHLAVDSDWDVVDLHSICACSPTLRLLPDMARARGYAVSVRQEEVCPVVHLPPSWEEYLESLNKKQRHELRRKLRRLQAETLWSWHTVRTADELPQGLADFFELHARSSSNKAGFWDDARRTFFRLNAESMLRAGWLHLSFLEINGKRAAAIYAYDYGDTLSLYNSGYDPAQGYYSVGVLLVALGIQEAIGAGKQRFDFLRGSEPYKYTFGAQDTAVFNVVIGKNDASCQG